MNIMIKDKKFLVEWYKLYKFDKFNNTKYKICSYIIYYISIINILLQKYKIFR
jgi:hypothetical protein